MSNVELDLIDSVVAEVLAQTETPVKVVATPRAPIRDIPVESAKHIENEKELKRRVEKESDRMRNWLHCFVVVDFEVEQGQSTRF